MKNDNKHSVASHIADLRDIIEASRKLIALKDQELARKKHELGEYQEMLKYYNPQHLGDLMMNRIQNYHRAFQN